ncbi:MAG TPA: DUF2254 family protein, partial [Woeseiaceae bacterium]
AQRSLADSPLQDPTTSVQAIDRLHDILRQLAHRPFPDGCHRDDAGKVRLEVPTISWQAYVRLAFVEIRLAGAASPQVSRRLMAALTDLREWAPAERTEVIDEEIRLLDALVRSSTDEADDAEFGLDGDPVGIGVAAGQHER